MEVLFIFRIDEVAVTKKIVMNKKKRIRKIGL